MSKARLRRYSDDEDRYDWIGRLRSSLSIFEQVIAINCSAASEGLS